MGRVLLILGTPGVGKSSLARTLAQNLGFQIVDIGVLVKRKGLWSGYDKSRKAFVINEKKVREELENIAKAMDTVVATNSLGAIIQPNWVKLAIVLRLDPVVLFRRLRARRWPRRKAWENVESELVDGSLVEAVRILGRRRVFELDTTSKSEPRVLSEALKIVKGRGRTTRLKVDWLSKYDPVDLERRFRWRSVSS